MVANKDVTSSVRSTVNGKHRKTLGFRAYFTHIQLPRKYVFSGVNSDEYVVVHSEDANEQKENKLFPVRSHASGKNGPHLECRNVMRREGCAVQN